MKLSFLHSASALLILYLIQGVFVGFTFGVKLLVQQHNATEAQQGILSLANYPFSFKVRNQFKLKASSLRDQT